MAVKRIGSQTYRGQMVRRTSSQIPMAVNRTHGQSCGDLSSTKSNVKEILKISYASSQNYSTVRAIKLAAKHCNAVTNSKILHKNEKKNLNFLVCFEKIASKNKSYVEKPNFDFFFYAHLP
jgi:hypothetical protein